MSATTPNVGVRVFSNLSSTTAAIDARVSYTGMALPCPDADNSIEKHKPMVVNTEDSELITLLGAGVARDTITQIASEGISTDLIFVRTDDDADADTQLGLVAGSAVDKTGMPGPCSKPRAKPVLEPGLIIAPGYTSQRPGDAANPVATAFDAICDQIIDCMAITDTLETTREAAVENAADFATSLNMIAMYPSALVTIDGVNVTRPLSPHMAAAIMRRDAEVGNPYKAAWNRPFKGIRGVSQTVSYQDGNTETDANYLVQNGVGTVIENKLIWAPYTTATDPTVKGYRSIKRIRTRRSIEKALLRALRKYNSEDLGPHLVSLIYQSVAEACAERVTFGALIDYELVWDKKLNPATFLRDGGLRVKLRFEETPDLTDLQVFTEPQPEAFDILSGRIGQALTALGNPNIRVTA
jgi:phage tail sheath protein FI